MWTHPQHTYIKTNNVQGINVNNVTVLESNDRVWQLTDASWCDAVATLRRYRSQLH